MYREECGFEYIFIGCGDHSNNAHWHNSTADPDDVDTDCSPNHLALFLLMVEEGMMIGANGWSEDYDKPLGNPLGPATNVTGPSGNTTALTRSFASGTKVTFDLETGMGHIAWAPSALKSDGSTPPPPPAPTPTVGKPNTQQAAGSCAGVADCGLLGVCDGGSCSCAPGFIGDSCGQLDLLPVKGGLPAAELWPVTGAANSSAWGFTVAYDPADKLYHAVADVSCGCALHSAVRSCSEYTGVLASGGYASSLIHLESARPDGGWRVVSLLAPPTSFNPHLIRNPTEGSFALYFRVNAVDSQPICVGNSSGPTPGLQSPGASLIKRCAGSSTTNCIHAGGSESGTNIYLATAPRMAGPWKVQSVGVQGEAKLHVSNPSVTFLRAGTPAAELGRVAMAFRYNSPHGETNGVASADGPEGPFVAEANLTCHGCECVC
jgi:hypothetical protein